MEPSTCIHFRNEATGFTVGELHHLLEYSPREFGEARREFVLGIRS
jgi:hypothetical protein